MRSGSLEEAEREQAPDPHGTSGTRSPESRSPEYHLLCRRAHVEMSDLYDHVTSLNRVAN